jgi:hypothetical protein
VDAHSAPQAARQADVLEVVLVVLELGVVHVAEVGIGVVVARVVEVVARVGTS